ncbi:MAG: hypothetical protein ATN35_07275 [Epulopiscium sp. Nele67-Bin004]|nr:MAG: hypothetical protein ATN35_07275 [Epulopiscium sp. Nele67-Bin004]
MGYWNFLIANIVQCCALQGMFVRLFEAKPAKKGNIFLSYLLMFIIMDTVRYLSNSANNGIYIYTSNAIGLFIILILFFRGSILAKIMTTIVGLVVVGCVELLVFIIFDAFIVPIIGLKYIDQLFLITLSLTLLSIPKIFDYCFDTSIPLLQKDTVNSRRQAIYIISVPLISCVIMFLMVRMIALPVYELVWDTIIMCVLMLVINVVYFVNYERLIKVANTQAEVAIANEQVKYYFNLYELLQKEHKEVLKLKHNFTYDLLSIQNAIEHADYEKALGEIKEKLEITHTSNSFICNVPIIDAIINYKLYEVRDTDIIINVQVSMHDSLAVENSHIANILGNLLDNAIYACKNNVGEKLIEVSIRQLQNNLYVSIINSNEQEIKFKKGVPISSKRDGAQYGIGIKTIQNIVDIYNGMLDIEVQNNKFIVDIVLFNCMT